MFKSNVSSANGVPMKQIQEWLGHSDFGAAANIYAYLDSRRNAQWLGLCAKLKKKSQQPEKTDYWRDFWRSGWDSNPRNLAVQLISS